MENDVDKEDPSCTKLIYGFRGEASLVQWILVGSIGYYESDIGAFFGSAITKIPNVIQLNLIEKRNMTESNQLVLK